MNREAVMTALYSLLTGPPMIFPFHADTTTGSATLANVSDTSALIVGMPISGPGIGEGATLATITPTVELSFPAIGDNTAAPLTQGFQTASRRLARGFMEADMPAMYLLDVGEAHPARESSSRPYLMLLHCELWMYSRVGADPSAVPSTGLNTLIDAVEKALIPSGSQPGGGVRQSLGIPGVHYCRIEGEVQKDPGYDGSLAGAIVPIQIAAASTLVLS